MTFSSKETKPGNPLTRTQLSRFFSLLRAAQQQIPALGLASLVCWAPHAQAAGADPTNPLKPWQGAYPLVADVDANAIPACNADVKLKLSLFDPTAVQKKQTLEWRVRIGGRTYKTGRVLMTKDMMSIALTIPYADVPNADTALQVDAKPVLANGWPIIGTYGRVWQDHIARGCNPVVVAAIGDSIVWGQGNDHQMKMTEILAQRLGKATGRGYRALDYSLSGAALDAPTLPVGNDDTQCNQMTYRQDPDNDGEMEFGEVTQQMPDLFCQVEKARQQALAGNYKVDAVVLNGCINDIDPLVGITLGLTPGSEDMRTAVLRECAGIGADVVNPALDVPYFSGAKLGYGGRGMKELIEKAHREIPGNPKIVLVPMVRPITEYTASEFNFCETMTGLPSIFTEGCDSADFSSVATRYDQFVRYQSEVYRNAVDSVNQESTDGPYAILGDGLYTRANAAYSSKSLLWDGVPGVGDPAEALRRHLCPTLSETPDQCQTATIMHPNIAGNQQFGESFAMEPLVRSWFGTTPQGAPSAEFSVSTYAGHPPFNVDFDASASHDNGRIVKYHWYFGDGYDAITTTPSVRHVYKESGPYLPRLIVTDDTGVSSMVQVDNTIIADNVPRIPAGFSRIKGSAEIDGAFVQFDLGQALPFVQLMVGAVSVDVPGVGQVSTTVPQLISFGPVNDKTQLQGNGSGINWNGVYNIAWIYTATDSGGYLEIDITGSVKAHIEGEIPADSIVPAVRNVFEILGQ